MKSRIFLCHKLRAGGSARRPMGGISFDGRVFKKKKKRFSSIMRKVVHNVFQVSSLKYWLVSFTCFVVITICKIVECQDIDCDHTGFLTF